MKQYENFDEKRAYFNECIIIDKIDSCVDHIKKYKQNHHQFYRGVSDASFMIFSSLQRKFVDRTNCVPNLSMSEFSQEIISKFHSSKVLSEALKKEVQSYNSEVAAWAFIQHFGGPSNLIDFTPKFETALFFATKEGKRHLHYDDDVDKLSNYISIYILPDNKYITGNVNGIYSSGSESACKLLKDWYKNNPNTPIDTSNVDREMQIQPLDIAMWGSSVYGERDFNITTPGNNNKLTQNYSNSHIAKQNGNFFVANINDLSPLEEAPLIRGKCNNISDNSTVFHPIGICLNIHKKLIPELYKHFKIPKYKHIYSSPFYLWRAKLELIELAQANYGSLPKGFWRELLRYVISKHTIRSICNFVGL